MSTALATPTTRAWLNKVPAITATFWVIKILSTTIGETFADYLTVNVGLGPKVTDLVMLGVLAVALTLQFRTRKVTPVVYWFTVICVSIVGTQITDFLTDTLGISLWVSTGVLPSSWPWSSCSGTARSARWPSPRSTPAPRGVLLGRHPDHVRPGHRRRRPRHRGARSRLPQRRPDLRRPDPGLLGGPQGRREPRADLLDRLHPHPPARSLDR